MLSLATVLPVAFLKGHRALSPNRLKLKVGKLMLVSLTSNPQQ